MEERVWLAVMRQSDSGIQVLLGKRGPLCGNAGTWGLFGGGVDKGERPIDAVLREAKEETGLILTTSDVTCIDQSLPFSGKILYWYAHTGGNIKKKDCALTEETVDYMWATLEESKKLALHYSSQLFFRGLEAAYLEAYSPKIAWGIIKDL